MKVLFFSMFRGRGLALSLLTFLLCLSLTGSRTAVFAAPALSSQTTMRLPGTVPVAAVSRAHALDRVPASQIMTLALALPLRDPAGAEAFLERLYDPSDPLYQHYIKPDEFTRRYSPTQQSYDAVAAFARAHGLVVIRTAPNRALLTVSGPAAAVEAAFAVRLGRYQAADGRVFFAPSNDPVIPVSLIGRLSGIVGLDNATLRQPLSHRLGTAPHPLLRPLVPAAIKPFSRKPTFSLKPAFGSRLPNQIGSDPNTGALTPKDIKTAYNLSTTALTGAGQTMGLYELDGYLRSDISTYNSTYGLTNILLENVLTGGFDGSAGGNAGEVTLDIEVMNALAPGASKLIVYEATNGTTATAELYNVIANDKDAGGDVRAKVVSVSWGLGEDQADSGSISVENTAFIQMSMQGQSVFIASGDSGAYSNGATISVNDPASNPYVTAVGGTTLTTNGPGGSYASETTWGTPSPIPPPSASNPLPRDGGGGGGISTLWPLPPYQKGVGESTTLRNLPDVSLDADPSTGYAIYVGGQWNIFGGTSVAAPLWAAFTTLANQQRAKYGDKPVGFANPLIYSIGKGAKFTTGFHDIADNSTNFFYRATPGYDNATGWGSFNGAGLLPLFAPAPNTTTTSIASITLTPNPVVGGLSVTGTVTLANPAPTAGATVTLTSSDAVVAPVPASFVIAAGQTTGTFTINTTATPGTTVKITASYLGSSLDAKLVVNPAPIAIVPASLSFVPPSVPGGATSQATVTLTGPAPTGGFVVALSSSDPAAQVPASVSIPAGSTSATFTVTTIAVIQQVPAVITASGNGGKTTGTLTILAPTLERIALAPQTVPGGQPATGTLTLTLPAPAGGAVVTLSSDNPAAAAVPATATIPAGATTTTFPITTKAVPKTLVATLTATLAGVSQKAKLEIRSARITGVSVAPASLTGGAPAVGTVTLDSPAAVAAGLVISLSSSAPAGTVPATVIVPLGASTVTFPVTTAVVPAPVLDTLTATLDSISKTTVLTIQPIQATSLVLTPPLVVAGLSSVGTVTVNAPAPPGGLVVTLSHLGAAETLPATVTVPAGATSATFTIGTPVAGTVTISAVAGGQTRTATLTVSTAVGTSFPAGLNMISVPYDYSGQPLDTLFGYANVHLATWDTLGAHYAYTSTAPADALRLGRSYFVKLPTAVTLTRVGTPADPTTDFSLPLSAGWNMIGDPFLVPVSLSAMNVSSGGVVSTFSTAVSGAPLLVSSLLYSYNQSTNSGKGGYVTLQTSGALQPGQGYWIYAYSNVTLIVPHPGQ